MHPVLFEIGGNFMNFKLNFFFFFSISIGSGGTGANKKKTFD